MFNQEFLYLTIFNALLYIITFVWYYVKKRVFDLGTLILLTYAISNTLSILYYIINYELIRSFEDLKVLPYLYLFSLLILCFYPLLKFNYNRVFYVSAEGNRIFIQYISILIILLTIEPLIENVYLAFKTSNSGADYLGEIYSKKFEGEAVSRLSWLGRKLNYLVMFFSTTSCVFFFYFLTKKRISKIILIGLGLAMINVILTSYNQASRGGVISYFLFICACYMLFRYAILRRRMKIINLLGFLIIAGGTFVTISITISRLEFQSTFTDIWSWISLYLGEGSLKFNNDLWHIKYHTNGDDIFCFAKRVLGLDTFVDNISRENYYFAKNGIGVERFYTFIGDFYYDFGKFGTPLLCMVIFSALKILTKKRVTYPLEVIFLLALIAHVFLIGFSAYIHRAYSAQLALVFPMLIISILFLNRKKYSNG